MTNSREVGRENEIYTYIKLATAVNYISTSSTQRTKERIETSPTF